MTTSVEQLRRQLDNARAHKRDVDVKQLRKQIDNATRRYREAGERVVWLQRQLQLECPHDMVLEAPYAKGIFSSDPEFRVCACCGFAEGGWSCGYQILTAERVSHVSRDEAHRAQVGPVWPNRLFVIPMSRREAPTTTREAYEMAVRGTLPADYQRGER